MSLANLGIDLAAVIAIGSITEYIKNQDPENKLKRFYVLIPIVLSAIVATGIALAQENYATILIDTIKYFGVSSLGYSTLKKVILNK